MIDKTVTVPIIAAIHLIIVIPQLLRICKIIFSLVALNHSNSSRWPPKRNQRDRHWCCSSQMRKIEASQIMPKKKTVMKNKMSSNLRLGMKSLRLLPLQAIVMVHPTNKQHLPTTKLRILTIIIIVTMQEEATNNHISLLRVLSHRKTCHSSGSPNMKTSQKLKKASF